MEEYIKRKWNPRLENEVSIHAGKRAAVTTHFGPVPLLRSTESVIRQQNQIVKQVQERFHE